MTQNSFYTERKIGIEEKRVIDVIGEWCDKKIEIKRKKSGVRSIGVKNLIRGIKKS